MPMRNFQQERNRQVAQEIHVDSDAIIEQIRPLLANRSPMLQGAVLAELVAIHIGGFNPEARSEMLRALVDTAIQFIALHDPWP
jgi:hypothetical protein